MLNKDDIFFLIYSLPVWLVLGVQACSLQQSWYECVQQSVIYVTIRNSLHIYINEYRTGKVHLTSGVSTQGSVMKLGFMQLGNQHQVTVPEVTLLIGLA